ncbi:hypothetical protein GCM10020000_09110 [Streptomyces olivoverticillatus]
MAEKEPPGELMYRETGRSGAAYSRCTSWAITSLAAVSSIGVPRMITRSESSFEYGSRVRVPLLVRSVNSGRT